jgi:magnesium transporter
MTEQTPEERLTAAELVEIWQALSAGEQIEGFQALDPADAEDFFLSCGTLDQATLVLGLPVRERRLCLRLLAPDDSADLLQVAPPERRGELLSLLDEPSRREVTALLAYAEDAAGGLMSPRFARVRPEMTVDEAVSYLRRQAREPMETIYYVYVLDAEQHLLGVVSFRELFSAPAHRPVSDVMRKDLIAVPEELDQEAVARLMARHDLMAVPVVDAARRMRGIVTLDDIVDVMHEEATEDIQKLGGMAALDTPYWQTGLLPMLRKRAGWLSILFLGEMLTATAMGRYEHEITRAVVLALFVPLIISSGGNSGSQASTLIVRAMALGEVRLRDVLGVARRELASGLALGAILALIGLARILVWQALFGSYGEHAVLVAATVALSLMGVVAWGTLSGALLPFALRSLGWDPASASAPFVATLVDVSGLVIYFSVAQLLLRGTLL